MASETRGRKRSVLNTLSKKLEIIEDLKKGKLQRKHMEKQGKNSIICGIYSDSPTVAKKDLSLGKPSLRFMQQRSRGAPISGPLLQEKALSFFPGSSLS